MTPVDLSPLLILREICRLFNISWECLVALVIFDYIGSTKVVFWVSTSACISFHADAEVDEAEENLDAWIAELFAVVEN